MLFSTSYNANIMSPIKETTVETAIGGPDGNRRQLLAADIPEEGTVECTNESTGKVYHWKNNELRHFPNGMIASSWDSNWRGNLLRVDCTDLNVGSPMAIKSIPEGKAVRCSNDNDGKVYRWVEGELRHYRNGTVAKSWDENWRDDIIDLDCESFPTRTDMGFNYPNCLLNDDQIGNGFCFNVKYPGFYNSEECGWDGGDCIAFNSKYPDCHYNIDQLGNGVCNDFLNREECGFDDGDCN